MKRFILILSLFIITFLNFAIGQVAVISEYYNRTATPVGEWTEILITADYVDLVGCTLRDNSESGDWQGGVRFKNIPLWQNLRKGTIIIVWHRRTGAPKDVNPSDGYLEVNAEDSDLFDKRLFAAPTWGVSVLNISQNIDIIQLLDASDNNIHSLGHSNNGETSSMSSITNYRLFHNGAISGDTYSIRVIPGRNIDEYNKGWDAGNIYTDESNTTSKGLPNINEVYPNENRLFWQSLRQPKWSSYKTGVSATVQGEKALIEWTPANYNMDPTEGYIILRVPLEDLSSTPAPVDGKIYKTGDLVGNANVIGVIYNLNQNQFIDTDFKNAESGRSYVYRIYAFRFGKDDEDMDGIPENVRGRIYNTSQFVQTDSIYKSQLPKPLIKSKDDRTAFCEEEDAYIQLIGDYGYYFSFQWYRNGVPLEGEKKNLLQVHQSGLYHIIVKDEISQSEATSDIINITIQPQPKAALFIKENDVLIPVLNDTIIYVCKENSRLYPHLILEGADSLEWFFNDRLKSAEINHFETIADQRGTYYGVVLNGLCADSTPKLTILYFDVKLQFDKPELTFIINSKMRDTLQVTNKSNASIYLYQSDFQLPQGISLNNISFPIIIKKDSSIQIEFIFNTIDTTHFYRVEKIFIMTVCNRSFDIIATMMNPEPQVLKILPVPDTLDFGIFAYCDFEKNKLQTLTLKSIGNLQAKVLEIQFPMSNIKVNTFPPFIIDSNSSSNIDLEILDALPKSFFGEIRIIYESIEATPKRETVFVYYKGEIVQPNLLFDSNLSFAIPNCSDTSFATIEFTNSTNIEINIDKQPTNPQLFIENLPITFAPNEAKMLRFRLISNTSTSFNDKIILEPCSIEKQINIASNKSNISIKTDISSIDFGDVAICDDANNARELKLQIQGSEVSIKNIEIPDDFMINVRSGDIFFSDTILQIKYVGNNPGETSGKLKIIFSPCDMIIEIDLSAIGVQPEITLSPENIIDFGDVIESTISTKSLKIKNLTNLTISIDLPISSNKFSLNHNIETPIILQANGEKEITFDYFNINPNEYDTLNLEIHIQPCDLIIPYKLIAHSIEDTYRRLVKIDLPDNIEGEPGSWVDIPVKFIADQFSFNDVGINSLKIDFEYNSKILYCKEVTGLNSTIANSAKIIAKEEKPNIFSVSIDSIPHPNPAGNDWMDFSITAQILQGDTLKELFKVKNSIIESSPKIKVEGDSSTINVIGDCLIENREVLVGTPSQASTILLSEKILKTNVNLTINTDLEIGIYNINGMLIKRNIYKSLKYGNYEIFTNVSDLTTGIYIIKVSSSDFLKYDKIILKN